MELPRWKRGWLWMWERVVEGVVPRPSLPSSELGAESWEHLK